MTDPFSQPGRHGGSLTLAEFLDRFLQVEEEQDGYVVTCPAHADGAPSLRVALNPTSSRLMLHCRAGCKLSEVLTALELPMSALFNVQAGDLANVRTTGAAAEPVSIAHRAALRMYLDRASGYAPYVSASQEYAEERFGITPARFVSLGLGADDGSLPSGIVGLSRDLYRDTTRLVVPFNDLDGFAHYLQARALDRDYSGRAKWSGPANPEGMTWGRYGWFPGDLPWDEIVVTEGPGDGLTAVGAGYDTLLIRGAALGLTDDLTAELATRFPDRRFILVGDNDKAGGIFNDLVGAKLTAAGLRADVLSLADGAEDLSHWRELDPEGFSEGFATAIRSANPWVPLPTETPNSPNEDTLDVESQLDATELGNAKRLARRMRGLIRHSSSLGFLVWNGSSWEVDTRKRVRGEAQAMTEELMTEAKRMPSGAAGSPQERRRLAALRWAHASQRSNAIDAVLKELQALPAVAVDAADLDQHRDLLACRNGTVDLKTGELRPADPKDLLTKALDIDYDPTALAPRWVQFFEECFPKNDAMVAYLQRLVGYGITGHATEQCFVILHGHGANGKSVFTEALHSVFTPVTSSAGIETFLSTGNTESASGPSSDLAALRGARLVLTSESDHGARLSEARIKRLTGGDPITARFLYKEPFTYYAQFLLFLSTNGLPEIRGTDDGIWRRVKVIHWAEKFTGARRDNHLSSKLRKEREGILAWAVCGAVEWYQHGIGEPPSVTHAVDEYRQQSHKLDSFIPGVIIEDPNGWMARGELYAAYQEWAESEGSDRSQMWKNNTLYAHFRAFEFVHESKRKGVNGFRGIRKAKPTELVDNELTRTDEDKAPSLETFTP